MTLADELRRARRLFEVGTCGAVFEVKRSGHIRAAWSGPGKSVRAINFIAISVSHKKGVGLALGRSLQINEQLQ